MLLFIQLENRKLKGKIAQTKTVPTADDTAESARHVVVPRVTVSLPSPEPNDEESGMLVAPFNFDNVDDMSMDNSSTADESLDVDVVDDDESDVDEPIPAAFIKQEHELIIEDTIQIANELFYCNICDSSFDSCDALDTHFDGSSSCKSAMASSSTSSENINNVDVIDFVRESILDVTDASSTQSDPMRVETMPITAEAEISIQLGESHIAGDDAGRQGPLQPEVVRNFHIPRDRSRSPQRIRSQNGSGEQEPDMRNANERDRKMHHERKRPPSPARKFIND